jgi:hypothetical protein
MDNNRFSTAAKLYKQVSSLYPMHTIYTNFSLRLRRIAVQAGEFFVFSAHDTVPYACIASLLFVEACIGKAVPTGVVCSAAHTTPVRYDVCIASHRIASHRIASHRIHRIASYRIASHRIASHRIASHRIASHRIASHRIAVVCRVMHLSSHAYVESCIFTRAVSHFGRRMRISHT